MSPSNFARYAALSCCIACGTEAAPPIVDTPPDDPPPPDNLVFVELFGSTPTFVRFRTNGGEWQEPLDTGDGYELAVYDDYELVAACANEFGSDVGYVASTVEESPSTYIPCYPILPSNGGQVAVTGTMKQPGSLYMIDRDAGDTPNWSFDLAISLGTHDLIALDADRAVVKRDLEILADTTLPAIDTAEGELLVDRVFTTDAAVDEDVTTSLLWFTGNSMAYIPLGGTAVKVPPVSLTQLSDVRYLSIDAASNDGYRTVYLTDAAAGSSIEFLPRLEGVAFNDDGVTWSGDLPGTDADLYLYEGLKSITMSVSAGWIAGRNKIAVDTDIPGFDPAWRISKPDYRGFSAGDSSATQFRSSSVYDFGAPLR